ncbi:MAG: 30S ribosomal protein S13 [Nitrosopumilus sp.]
MSSQEYRHIVRIVGNDIPGERKVLVGLTQIKGIGHNFATAVLDSLKIDTNSNIGNLTDDNVQAIEKLITDPVGGNFPIWFLNRRKDIETGSNLHLLTSDIPFTLRNDIERERITASWRGYRHMNGLKVRGQRTRTTGRKAGAVGVAKGGQAAPAKKTAAAPAAVDPSSEAAAPAAVEKKEEPAEKTN